MEKKPYNPREHVVWPEGSKEDKIVQDAFNPESFISLDAVVDVEKARIAAEAIHQRLQPLFEDMATAEIMLAEAKNYEDKTIVEEEIRELRNRIKEEVDKKTLISPMTIDAILRSSRYGTFAHWYHQRQKSGMRGASSPLFSVEERNLIKRYDEIAVQKALEFLNEANKDQKNIFAFLVSRNFHIPEASSDVSEEDRYLFGRLFCVVMERVTTYSLSKESDNVLFENFKKRFLEKYNDIVSFRGGKKPFDIEAYLAKPEAEEALRLWRYFGIETSGPEFLGVGVRTQNSRTGEWESGDAQYSRSFLNIRYDTSDITKALKEKAKEFLVPETPDYVEITEIPFSRKMGSDLSLSFKKAENLGKLIKEDPQNALKKMSHGDNWVFSNFQLSELFEEQEEQKNKKKRSASYLFLGIEN